VYTLGPPGDDQALRSGKLAAESRWADLGVPLPNPDFAGDKVAIRPPASSTVIGGGWTEGARLVIRRGAARITRLADSRSDLAFGRITLSQHAGRFLAV